MSMRPNLVDKLHNWWDESITQILFSLCTQRNEAFGNSPSLENYRKDPGNGKPQKP